jgi:hypothetical protein
MSTEFNDASHYGFFMTGTTLTSSTGKYIRQSELALAALRAQGVLDNMIDGTAPPTTDKLWLDKNTDPAVLKEWDPTGSAWMPMTFQRLFGRAIVTPLATPTGTANALVVAAPSPFIPNRMYSLTPVADNSGSATIQVTGVGTYPVKYPNGGDIVALEFRTGKPTILLFTGLAFQVIFSIGEIYAAVDDAEAAAAAALGAANAGFVFDTQVDLAAANVPALLSFVQVAGGSSPVDGLGVAMRRVVSEPSHGGKQQSADGAWWEDPFYANFTVNVPTDFATVQAAIDALSRVKMRHKARILVKLAAGVTWSTLQLENGDFSQFVIQSVDAEVPVPTGFNGNIIRGINADMPTLDCLINAANQSAGEGIWLSGVSTMVINPGKGVKNSWGTGLLGYLGPRVAAQGSIFTGNARNNTTGAGITAWGAYIDASDGDVSHAGYYGAQAAHGGTLTFERGKANDVYRYGIRGSDAGIIDFSEGEAHRAGVYGIYAFQNSHINAPGAMATECGTANATCVNASTLNIRQADLRNSLGHGLLTSSGLVDAFGAQFDGANNDGINATGGAIVYAGGATAAGCTGRGYYAAQGAQIAASLAVASNCSSGFYAERKGVIEAEGGTATGCAFDGAIVDTMGEINIPGATLTGNSRSGARALAGGKINVTNSQCRKVVGVDDTGTSTADIQAFTGANIIAHGAVGGANRAINTLSTQGIVYR